MEPKRILQTQKVPSKGKLIKVLILDKFFRFLSKFIQSQPTLTHFTKVSSTSRNAEVACYAGRKSGIIILMWTKELNEAILNLKYYNFRALTSASQNHVNQDQWMAKIKTLRLTLPMKTRGFVHFKL